MGGADECSTSSETNDGTRAPYAASMSVNDSDTADWSDSWLNTESVGELAGSVGDSGDIGDAGMDARRVRGKVGVCGNDGTGGMDSTTEIGPSKVWRRKWS